MSDVKRYIPKKIDDPLTILFMEPLQFALVMSSLGIGMALDALLLGGVMAYGLIQLTRSLKRGSKRGAGQHALWAAGINLDASLQKYFPDPFDNEFVT